jgi:hypothetical protein
MPFFGRRESLFDLKVVGFSYLIGSFGVLAWVASSSCDYFCAFSSLRALVNKLMSMPFASKY